jgi:hypothetical protein
MERRFTRLRPGGSPPGPGYYVVPNDGMCLSTFLVLEHPEHAHQVLLGHLDPQAPWFELGSLEGSRLASIGARWMLPSSQLLFFEGPEEAARRILREQLVADLPDLPPPRIVSEAYRRPNSTATDPHWDLQFIYRARWPHAEPPRARPWKELVFVDVRTLSRAEIGRGHGDILELAGLPPRD